MAFYFYNNIFSIFVLNLMKVFLFIQRQALLFLHIILLFNLLLMSYLNQANIKLHIYFNHLLHNLNLFDLVLVKRNVVSD